MKKETAKEIYDALIAQRDQFLHRAKTAAGYTIPYFAHLCDTNIDHYGDTPQLEMPWNSIGTRGLQRLATKLLLALMPPNEPFFRLTINEVEYAMSTQGMDPEEARKGKVEFETALSVLERAQLNTIASSNDRVALFEILQHLLIVGNVLGFIGEDSLSVFHLRNYVVQRDSDGQPWRLVICESKLPDLLPGQAKEIWDNKNEGQPSATYGSPSDTRAHIYTRIEWKSDGGCEWWQEILDAVIPGSEQEATKAECPWLPLRMHAITGWNYSPGYVESSTIGDLHTIDQLSQAVAEGSLGAARLLWGQLSGCPTTAKAVANAKNGAVIPVTSEKDIFAIQAKIGNDLSVAAQTLMTFEQRASTAFSLLNVRDSERTTQEEIIRTAQEGHEMFASLYMILSVEFCYPYVLAKFARMKRALPGVFATLQENLIQPVVSVGLSAVGRGSDLERFATFIRIVKDLFGPEAAQQFTNPVRMFQQLAVASNLPSLDSIKTEEQASQDQANAEQARQQEMQMRLAEAAARSPMADPAKQAIAEKTQFEMGQPPPNAGPTMPPMPQ
jgi:hypothetical protein